MPVDSYFSTNETSKNRLGWIQPLARLASPEDMETAQKEARDARIDELLDELSVIEDSTEAAQKARELRLLSEGRDIPGRFQEKEALYAGNKTEAAPSFSNFTLCTGVTTVVTLLVDATLFSNGQTKSPNGVFWISQIPAVVLCLTSGLSEIIRAMRKGDDSKNRRAG